MSLTRLLVTSGTALVANLALFVIAAHTAGVQAPLLLVIGQSPGSGTSWSDPSWRATRSAPQLVRR